jgi:hypothetical protein
MHNNLVFCCHQQFLGTSFSDTNSKKNQLNPETRKIFFLYFQFFHKIEENNFSFGFLGK